MIPRIHAEASVRVVKMYEMLVSSSFIIEKNWNNINVNRRMFKSVVLHSGLKWNIT